MHWKGNNITPNFVEFIKGKWIKHLINFTVVTNVKREKKPCQYSQTVQLSFCCLDVLPLEIPGHGRYNDQSHIHPGLGQHGARETCLFSLH